jgi:glycosyltransferase involved in cell wall biosynthesis
VPSADSKALAAAIQKLAADPQRRQAMGQQGRSYVEKNFDRGMLARQYRKLLGSS